MKKFTFSNGSEVAVGSIFCIGRNYAEHAKEMGAEVPTAPLVFLKPKGAICAPNEPIILPAISTNVHHEVECVVVIGKKCKNATVENARDFIAGVAIGIDCTLRDVQTEAKKKGEPWTLSKGFDSSAPVSIVQPISAISAFTNLEVELVKNGVSVQRDSLQNMERSVEELISYLSTYFTMYEGDCIFTGTPSGVAQMKSGDTLEATLRNISTSEIVCSATWNVG